MILTEKNIRTFTPQGLTYVDSEGQEQSIDFKQCYENYISQRTSSSAWQNVKKLNTWVDENREDYIERIKRFKEVGTRNVLTPPWADGPYIEFYTLPPIRFKFDSLEKYHEVGEAIRRAGWRTADLS